MTVRCYATSVVVAGVSSWHPGHVVAHRVLTDRAPVIAQVLVESYAVLTRLPGAQRVRPDLAWKAVRSVLAGDPLTLPSGEIVGLLDSLSERRIDGGATYDAIIAATALSHGHGLISLDRRAARTYESIGVDYHLISQAE